MSEGLRSINCLQPVKLVEQLAAEAARLGISRTQLVRTAIEAWLERSRAA